jgi:GTP cyclohydrolase II
METVISLPSSYGELELFHFNHAGQEGLVAKSKILDKTPFVRIHSSCVFSESFHTIDCDCGKQLDAALEYIKAEGGVVIYLYQEGRGLGLKQKIQAISLEQNEGIDTASAFKKLGHDPDPRSYTAAVHVLKKMGISSIVLDTSNPRKIDALTQEGIEVSRRIHLTIETNELIEKYRSLKVRVLGHHEND